MADKTNEKKVATAIERVTNYQKHQMPEKCCQKCRHAFCPNPGANIPGIACKLLAAMGEAAGEKFAHRIVQEESVCDFYCR